MIPESQREFRFSVGILSSCEESNLSPLGGILPTLRRV